MSSSDKSCAATAFFNANANADAFTLPLADNMCVAQPMAMEADSSGSRSGSARGYASGSGRVAKWQAIKHSVHVQQK